MSLSFYVSFVYTFTLNQDRLREKYRKVPLSLYEGASSEMELPIDERIPLHDNLNSPRARPDNYLELIKTSSTPDLRAARQNLRKDEDLLIMALSNSSSGTENKQNYGSYRRKYFSLYI